MSVSIGSIWQGGRDLSWRFSARHIDTNKGNTPTSGHTVATSPVQIDELLAIHERPLWIGWLRVALGFRDTTYVLDSSLDENSAFGWIEFVVR